MIDPERAVKAYVAVWTLKATNVPCDHCSRPAVYAVFHSNVDYYMCPSHTAGVLERRARAMRTRTAFAAS